MNCRHSACFARSRIVAWLSTGCPAPLIAGRIGSGVDQTLPMKPNWQWLRMGIATLRVRSVTLLRRQRQFSRVEIGLREVVNETQVVEESLVGLPLRRFVGQ